MFSKCCWLPWPDGLHILWSYFRSHTAVSELSDVLTPGNPHARPCNGNAMTLPPMANLSRQVMGERHGIAAQEGGGARLGVPRSQAEPKPLKRPILDPFWSNLWCLSHVTGEALETWSLASITRKAPPDLPDLSGHWIMCCYVKKVPVIERETYKTLCYISCPNQPGLFLVTK